MAAWPSNLPLPRVDGYQLNPLDQVARTIMEVGAPRARRRTAARLDTVAAQWMMTDAEYAAFRSFVDATIDGGAMWFTMSVDTDGAIVSKECRFVGPFQAAKVGGGFWLVSAKLEVR